MTTHRSTAIAAIDRLETKMEMAWNMDIVTMNTIQRVLYNVSLQYEEYKQKIKQISSIELSRNFATVNSAER